MTTAQVLVHGRACRVSVDDLVYDIPIGAASLAASIVTDPPAPEELVNAIGLVLDHLEDAGREVPPFQHAERVEISGPGVATLADVEVGGSAALPFELSRAAAEDVFRTLATERAADRRRNPGLPAHEVHDVLGVACAVVAVMRFLAAESVWVTVP
jgi:exopolyphosphatase/guanosine-5'-triphosphate,3'-diphosphate pyrophosphatase